MPGAFNLYSYRRNSLQQKTATLQHATHTKTHTFLKRYAGKKRGDEMVKIKVSYTDEYELHALKLRLGTYVDKVKIPKVQKGKFKKAYIDLKGCHVV